MVTDKLVSRKRCDSTASSVAVLFELSRALDEFDFKGLQNIKKGGSGIHSFIFNLLNSFLKFSPLVNFFGIKDFFIF